MLEKLPDKIPPQSIEAEQSLLGSLMLDKDAIIKVVDFLQSRDFYKGIHQEIYTAMTDIFGRGEPVDVLSVSTRLKEKEKLEEIGGNAYLTELINSIPTATHVLNYAKIVQKKRILRDMIEASHEIGLMGYAEEEDVEELLDQAEKRIFSIAQKSLSQNFVPVGATLEEAFERIDRLSKHGGEMRGLPTGFTDLDHILAGLQKSDFIILASRPSMGKSALAVDIARSVAKRTKLPVGIFSLEMSKDQVVDRMIAAQAGVDLWKLRTGRLSNEGPDNDFNKIQQALGVLSEMTVYIDDAASTNILQMRALARRLQAAKGLSLIIVDYLQLMESRNIQANAVQQVTEISRSLKGLARELNIPVLALSQLSRSVEFRSPPRPRLSDLRESGCLTGDTLIIKADTGERISIKELAERKEQKALSVFAVDQQYKVQPHQAIKVFYSGKKMVFELKTRSGRKIKASANHPFLKINGWQRLDELKIGDHVALPRTLVPQKPKNPLSNEELILMAHLLGDGCILPNQPFHYTSADKENIQTVEEVAKKLFNIKGRLVKQKNWYHVYLTSPYHLTHGKHHPITNWFKKLGLDLVHSWKKQIPEAVFQSDQDKISLFLKHLWSTDGNLSWKRLPGRKPAGNIYYATSSPVLSEQVQSLLLRLNIQSSLREVPQRKKTKEYRMMYHIYIEGVQEQLKFLTKVGVADERKTIVPQMIKELNKIEPGTNVDIIPKIAWQTIIEPAKEELDLGWRAVQKGIGCHYCGTAIFKNGISRERMMRLCLALEKNPLLHDLATSDVFWDKIVSIKKLGIEDVYDATVPGAHNFVANDIIVHNSLEQDADVVLFIYREKEMGETVPSNIAEIIIAKHRNGPVGAVKLFFDSERVTYRNLEKDFQE